MNNVTLDLSDVASMVERLVDKRVTVGKAPRATNTPVVHAWFEDEHGETAAIVQVAVEVAAAMGAALSLRPPAVIRNIGTPLPKELEEDFQEVVNVLGGWINEHAPCHTRLIGLRYGPVPRRQIRDWTTAEALFIVENYGQGALKIAIRAT